MKISKTSPIQSISKLSVKFAQVLDPGSPDVPVAATPSKRVEARRPAPSGKKRHATPVNPIAAIPSKRHEGKGP